MSAESNALMQQFRQAVYERLTNPGIAYSLSPEEAIERRSILFRDWQSELEAGGEEANLRPDLARHWAAADVTAIRDVRADRQAFAEENILKNISASPTYGQILLSIDAKLFEQVKAAAVTNEPKIEEKLAQDLRKQNLMRHGGLLADEPLEGQGREEHNAGFVGDEASVYQVSAQDLAATRALDLDIAQVLSYADTSNIDDLSLAVVEMRIGQVHRLGLSTLKDVIGSDPALFYDTALTRLAPAFALTASAPATAYFASLEHKELAREFASKARDVVLASAPESSIGKALANMVDKKPNHFFVRVNLTYVGYDEFHDEETHYYKVNLEKRWPDVNSAKEFIDDDALLEAIVDGMSLESIEVFDALARVVAQKIGYGTWLEPIFLPSANENALARISALRSEASVEGGWDNYATAEGLRNRAHAIELQLNLGAVYVARAFEAAGRKHPPAFTVEERSALFNEWQTELGTWGQTENRVPEKAPADRHDLAVGNVSTAESDATRDKPNDERLAVEGAVELVKAVDMSLCAKYADNFRAYRIEKATARRMEDQAYKMLAAVQLSDARAAVAAEWAKISDNELKSSVRFDVEKHRAAVAAQATRPDAPSSVPGSSDLPEDSRTMLDKVGIERERESGYTAGPEPSGDKPGHRSHRPR